MPFAAAAARPAGLALGVLADVAVGDPRRWHPVAGFGRLTTGLERRLYADSVPRGGLLVLLAVGGPVALGATLDRVTAGRPVLRAALTATATWVALGGRSLAGEGSAMAACLESGDLAQARSRLRNLCARDAADLDPGEVARATVESLAENASDAVVAPLLWGAVAGPAGLLGYRAANTLDAMVGYRSPRYLRFGRVAARTDDVVNVVPARVSGLLVVAAARSVGGSPARAWATMRRDGGRHPSPNAGHVEAAVAGALGVRLGGANSYHGRTETRPELGSGQVPDAGDIRRAVRLGQVVCGAGAALAVTAAVLLDRRRAR